MHIYIKRTTPAERCTGLICLGFAIAGFLFVRFADRLLALMPPCLFHLWTGLPCPTCGATRTGIALSHLHLRDAFITNPLFFLIYTALILWGMNTLLGVVVKKNAKITLSLQEKKLVRKLLISAVFANWLYLILTTLF
ncbi:DUF2752 domain-containing protein [candidate division KSB1 bacterium]|nr:DUF2752 domain-containing protein [candidate division KSB1 bacterium]RQW00874.1 MAG: DUF2752 domain-containing protein [candidate division KSB1 bacterium]